MVLHEEWKTIWDISKRLLRDCILSNRGLRRVFAGMAACDMIRIGLGVASPLLVKVFIDGVVNVGTSFTNVIASMALFVAAWIGTSIVASVRLFFSSRMISDTFGALSSLALRGAAIGIWQGKLDDSGRALGNIERSRGSLSLIVDGVLGNVAPVALQAIITLGVIVIIFPIKYVALVGFTLLCYFLYSYVSSGSYTQRTPSLNASTGTVSSMNADFLRNARRIVGAHALSEELVRIRETNDARTRVGDSVSFALMRLATVQWLIVGACVLLTMGIAASDVRAGILTAGDLVMIESLTIQFALPISSFGFVLRQARPAFENIRDLFGLADLTPRDAVTRLGRSVGGGTGWSIRVDHVSYSYPNGRPGLLNVSCLFEAGKFILIAGLNGSGKSTLLGLLSGAYEAKTGQITFLTDDLSKGADPSVSDLVLAISQPTTLFNRTIRDNILFAGPKVEDEVLRNMLENLSLDVKVPSERLLGTRSGELGRGISSGQSQKIELVRAIISDKPILVLDEVTSALDTRAARSAFDLMADLARSGKLVVLASHQLGEAGPLADRIVLMSDGKIASVGGHEELSSSSELYRSLLRKQASSEAVVSLVSQPSSMPRTEIAS